MNLVQILTIIAIALEGIVLIGTVTVFLLTKITRKTASPVNANILSASGKITIIIQILALNVVVVLITQILKSIYSISLTIAVIHILALLLSSIALSILSFSATARGISVSSGIKGENYSCYIRPHNQSDEQKAGDTKWL